MLFRMRLCKKTHTRRTSLFCMYLSWGKAELVRHACMGNHVPSHDRPLALMTSHEEMQLEM